jgi:hemolysin activation/secretion protein
MTRPFVRAIRPPLLALMVGLAVSAMAQTPPKVSVQSYKVSGNTLLPAERIDAVLARYTGERSLDELQQAAQAVQALYRDAGYGAVVAFVPEQTSPAGQVLITVIEGRLARVVVDGNRQFDTANIRASLPSLVEGQTPRVREIDAQIQLANENPAKTTDVLLQPGERAGEVEARIQVTEQPVSRFTVGVDDTGNETNGRLRANLGWQHAGLWNRDHVMALQLQVAPEKLDAVAVLSANYRIPFYAAGMALDAYAAYSDVDGGTTATAAGPLQFSGKGRIAGARLSKYLPRVGEIDQRVVVGLDHRDYINSCALGGFGRVPDCDNSVSVQPLSVEYIVQKAGRTAWGASIGVQHNLQIGGGHAGDENFKAVRNASKPRYTLVRVGLFAGITVAEEWQIQTRLVGQATGDALVPGEQFGIGGASSVRGYDEREVTGDSGAAASVELWSPDMAKALSLKTGSLRWIGFADAGWVRNRADTPCRAGIDNNPECSLGAVGAGLRYSAGPLQVRFDLAQPLRAAVRTGRHDTRAHFSVSYSF